MRETFTLITNMFNYLNDFVSSETFKNIDWDYNDEYRAALNEIKDIHKWWVEIRPNRFNDYEDIAPVELSKFEVFTNGLKYTADPETQEYKEMKTAFDERTQLLDFYDNQDRRMMARLVLIYKYLDF